MKRVPILWAVGSLLIFSSVSLSAQTQTSSSGADATPLLTSVFKAVLGGTPLKAIQLSGNATWHVGSEIEQGTVSASAETSGKSSLQITGGANRLETESAIGPERLCQWSGGNSQTQTVDSMNCLKPMAWLFPALTLQPGLTPSSAGYVDCGLSAFRTGKLRDLQSEMVLSDMPPKLQAYAMRRSTMDLGIDPVTFLPEMLTYRVHPDNGAPLEIAIAIRYSDYRKIGNAEIPFHIQRYINGTLQLDLQITSATLS